MAKTKNDSRKPKKQRGNGRGTLWQLPDGRYRWQITLGYRANGKRISASGTVKDKTAAELALAKAITDHARGILAAPERITVAEYAEKWLERQKQLATSTRRAYTQNLRYALEYLGRTKVRSVRPHHIKDTLSRLADQVMTRGMGRGRPMSASTLAQVRGRLRSLFSEAVADGLISVNPAETVRRIKVSRTEHPGISLDFHQVERLHVLGEALYAAGVCRLWPALFAAVSVGMRRGEVMGLRWLDLDFSREVIHVRQNLTTPGGKIEMGRTKTDGSTRDVIMPSSLKAVLERQREAMLTEARARFEVFCEESPVFATRLGTYTHPDNLPRSLAWLLRWSDPAHLEPKEGQGQRWTSPLLGIPVPARATLEATVRSGEALPRISPHDLRHTAGTLMLRRGVPIEVVSKTLGHRDISITYRIYRHVLESERREHVVDLFEGGMPERAVSRVPLN